MSAPMVVKITPAIVSQIASLATAGGTCRGIARQLGISAMSVYKWAARAGIELPSRDQVMSKRTPKLIARLRSLAEAGGTSRGIAREIGLSQPTISRWAREEGIALPNFIEGCRRGKADPSVRARMSEAHRGRPRPVRVPAWVPEDLHADYRDHAADFGEEAAASHCRRLKREATS